MDKEKRRQVKPAAYFAPSCEGYSCYALLAYMQHPGFSFCYNRIPCHYVLHPERKIVHGAILSHPLFPSALPAGIQTADTSPSDVPAAYSGAKGSLPFAFILALIARPVHSLRFVILPGCSLILRNPALTSTLRYCCEGSRHLTPI
ncbi:hypothetical protein ACYZFV_20365 [Serratia ureilytica]